MHKFVSGVLVFLFGSLTFAEPACSYLFKFPFGEALSGVRSKYVVGIPPRSIDYEARIENGDKIQLLRNLPEVSGKDLVEFMERGESLPILRDSNGNWVTYDKLVLPEMTANRLEAMYKKGMQALSHIENVRFDSADIRFDHFPDRPATAFHPDGPPRTKNFIAISNWDRPATYVQGKSGAIIQAHRSEAVVMETGPEGVLHAYPAGQPVLTSYGVFVRLFFSTRN